MFEADTPFLHDLYLRLRERVPGPDVCALDLTPGRGHLAWSLWHRFRASGARVRVEMAAEAGGPGHAALVRTEEAARRARPALEGGPAILTTDTIRSARDALRPAYDVVFLATVPGFDQVLPLLAATRWRWLVVLSASADWVADRPGLERVDLLRGTGRDGGRACTAHFGVWRRAPPSAVPSPASAARDAFALDVAMWRLNGQGDVTDFMTHGTGLDGDAAYADYAPGRTVSPISMGFITRAEKRVLKRAGVWGHDPVSRRARVGRDQPASGRPAVHPTCSTAQAIRVSTSAPAGPSDMR